jgi:hypothetical protein
MYFFVVFGLFMIFAVGWRAVEEHEQEKLRKAKFERRYKK